MLLVSFAFSFTQLATPAFFRGPMNRRFSVGSLSRVIFASYPAAQPRGGPRIGLGSIYLTTGSDQQFRPLGNNIIEEL
jgi:hypothetical protein